MNEKTLMHKIMIAMTNAGARVFRNQVGMGYHGEPVRTRTPKQVTLYPGDVLIRQARPFKAGLIAGSSDIVGWMPTDRGALFVACEVKDEDGRLIPEQENFLGAVRHAGGIAIEGRSVDQVVSELRDKSYPLHVVQIGEIKP